MFAYEFMRNAFWAATFIAITCGVVGVYVVARNFSFLAHTLSEIGFAGAAFAILMGLKPLTGMLIFALLGSIGVGELSMQTEQKESSISAISAFFVGLGILFLSLFQLSQQLRDQHFVRIPLSGCPDPASISWSACQWLSY